MQDTVWRIAEGTCLHWAEWDGESVLFHENSANIHQLNPVAAAAVRLLLEQPANRETLVQKTASALSIKTDAVLGNDIDDLLSQLKMLGVIQAAPDENR